MSLSPLKKFVVAPVIVSAAVFTGMTLPLALLGSQPVDIKLQEEHVYNGRLRDVATPYLGLATLLSMGAGVATAAVMGWRHSSRKSAEVEVKLSNLQQHLKQKEELLEELKLSEPRLQAFGLSAFLEDEVTEEPAQTTQIPSEKVSEPVVVQTPTHVVEPLVIAAQPVLSAATTNRNFTVQAAASAFPSAQTFLAYKQANVNGSQETVADTAVSATVPALSTVEELQNQLQQMMAQMQSLQNSLQVTTESRALQQEESADFNINEKPPVAHQLQFVDTWQMKKVAAS